MPQNNSQFCQSVEYAYEVLRVKQKEDTCLSSTRTAAGLRISKTTSRA